MEFVFKYSGPVDECPALFSGNAIKNIHEQLDKLLTNQIKIMALIDDLQTQVTTLQGQATDLQASLDAEQAQIQQLLDSNASVVTDLNNQITALKEQIANGATPEQLQTLADGLTVVANSLATTKTDLEGTVADTTIPAPEA